LEVFSDDARKDIRARADNDFDWVIGKVLRLSHRKAPGQSRERTGESDNPRD
jgi:hypothetical protein